MFTIVEQTIIVYGEVEMLINEENDLVRKVLDNFIEKTNLAVKIIHNFNKVNRYKDFEIEIIHEEYKWSFDVVVKKWINAAMLGLLIETQNKKNQKVIVITNYVMPKVATKMRQAGIQYIDAAGNIFIREFPLHIEITGKKLEDRVENRVGRRLFYPAGLQVIFGLLCLPRLENETYREIAGLTGVALGTVVWTFKDLKETGFIIETKDIRRRLVRKEELLRKWIEAYHERLRPKQMRGKYLARNNDWWKNTKIIDYDAEWGGEVGAATITNYLIPGVKTIYAKGNGVNKLILREGMLKDKKGDIEIINKFWNFQTPDNNNFIVPPILIYADLIGTGENRNIETARLIYAGEIEQHLKEV